MIKIDVGIRNSNGNTPIHCAILNGKYTIVQELVDVFFQEINFGARNQLGLNPIQLALGNNRPEIAKYLFKFECDQKYLQTFTKKIN